MKHGVLIKLNKNMFLIVLSYGPGWPDRLMHQKVLWAGLSRKAIFHRRIETPADYPESG
ncbi:hypothetical protein QKW35_13710 [Pontibacterium granulatum]|uniref:hypothetical protein n=1 Tax=Pontibacterium granulatum TaxID=2036029 RepID=UPI00249C9C34|nr:hypothetical protein [Pontibacterium granulatum]MDI3325433.1 hypothetical protein [Pontibacterium granulatum]